MGANPVIPGTRRQLQTLDVPVDVGQFSNPKNPDAADKTSVPVSVAIEEVQADTDTLKAGTLILCADCDGERHEHSVTIGAEGEPLPPHYDAAQLQADIAAAADHAAKMAESKARRRALIAGLVTP